MKQTIALLKAKSIYTFFPILAGIIISAGICPAIILLPYVFINLLWTDVAIAQFSPKEQTI